MYAPAGARECCTLDTANTSRMSFGAPARLGVRAGAMAYSTNFAYLEFYELRLNGVLGSWSTLRTGSTTTSSGSGLTNNPGVIRSGYPDGALALGVLGAECPKRFARLVDLVGLLDGHPERPGLEQSCETL